MDHEEDGAVVSDIEIKKSDTTHRMGFCWALIRLGLMSRNK